MDENGKYKRRVRSSPYPYYDLGKCINLIKMIYKQAKLFEIPIEKGIKAMDLSPDSSTGLRAVAALTMFGLLDQRREGDTRQVKISTLGKEIIMSSHIEGGKSDLKLIEKAALKPPIIRHFWERYSETGLPSDQILEIHMLEDDDFIVSNTAVETVIDVFKTTMEYAELLPIIDDLDHIYEDLNDDEDEVPEDHIETLKNEKPHQDIIAQNISLPPKKIDNLVHSYPLGEGRSLQVSFPVDAKEHELELLRNWIKFVIDSTIEMSEQNNL